VNCEPGDYDGNSIGEVQIVEDLTINRPRFVARGKGSVSLIVVFITVGEVVMISLSGEDFLVRFVEEVAEIFLIGCAVRHTLSLHNLKIFIHQSIKTNHISRFARRYHMQIKVSHKLVIVITFKFTYIACSYWSVDKYHKL
jgi:hypothetical protein